MGSRVTNVVCSPNVPVCSTEESTSRVLEDLTLGRECKGRTQQSRGATSRGRELKPSDRVPGPSNLPDPIDPFNVEGWFLI